MDEYGVIEIIVNQGILIKWIYDIFYDKTIDDIRELAYNIFYWNNCVTQMLGALQQKLEWMN